MIATRNTTCGLCLQKILAHTDRIARWDVRWVHEDCYARRMERALAEPPPSQGEDDF